MLSILLALALLGLYAAAIIAVWRVPFRAFGVLVGGMAVHNFLLMVLLRLGTPGFLVRVLQSWKEGLLLLLAVLLVRRALPAWRARRLPRLDVMDWAAAAFAVVLVIYLVVPASLFHSDAGYTRRVIEFRQLILIPLLYTYGRVFTPVRRQDLTWVLAFILGAAGVVGLFGIIELFLVPTTAWLNWGVTLLSDWLHYAYNGPQHFPDFFFQTTSNGLFLRRMVSTYVSPLGIAYTGLLIVPLAFSVFDTRRSGLPPWFRGIAISLLLVAILLSVTRLAIGLLVVEMILLLILLRRRWLLLALPIVAALAWVALFQYVNFGPLLTRDLQPVTVRPSHMSVVPVQGSTSDPSIRGHIAALGTDIGFAITHPLGMGLGNSIHQYGTTVGRGESAIFDIFDDAGVVAGLLYLALYAMAIVNGFMAWRATRGDPLLRAIPLVACVGGLIVAPITLTSDVYGDFSVTFLFWWAAGYALTARSPGAARPAEAGSLDRRAAQA